MRGEVASIRVASPGAKKSSRIRFAWVGRGRDRPAARTLVLMTASSFDLQCGECGFKTVPEQHREPPHLPSQGMRS